MVRVSIVYLARSKRCGDGVIRGGRGGGQRESESVEVGVESSRVESSLSSSRSEAG